MQENPCTHPVVILRDSTYADVEGLVRYIYRGEVDVEPDRLQSFLRTAELLKIKGLADQNLAGATMGGSCDGNNFIKKEVSELMERVCNVHDRFSEFCVDKLIPSRV